ncbi:hypothetical protein ACFFX1_53990 [Dactylosporangium sucinum]|uniref:Uncharacterized protein n=1 Tax=Dactylosporangium sucinum TaxID=1424081 RepID=A0A917U8W5_9ACTN|nr:hypothetical protein [Dactylosporangium sucinum]GGM61158.1 hypothetical protein GCM10007977_073370 [Dactylosporangium sucinum]
MRRDWRETYTVMADVALVGLAVTAASVPLVTAGAALRAGSAAIASIVAGEGVDPRRLWRIFRSSLLPGLAATALAVVVAWLLLFNVGAVASGRVPGGLPVLVGTGAAAVALLAVAVLTVVRLGRDDVPGWRAAVRWAAGAAWRQPVAAAMVAGVSTIAAALAAMVPVTAPLLVGYLLFAAHIVTARLVRTEAPA